MAKNSSNQQTHVTAQYKKTVLYLLLDLCLFQA
jgi:hypothetical protein